MNTLSGVIFLLTFLVELVLLAAMVCKKNISSDSPHPHHRHFTAREKKFPKSRQNSVGTWVID